MNKPPCGLCGKRVQTREERAIIFDCPVHIDCLRRTLAGLALSFLKAGVDYSPNFSRIHIEWEYGDPPEEFERYAD